MAACLAELKGDKGRCHKFGYSRRGLRMPTVFPPARLPGFARKQAVKVPVRRAFLALHIPRKPRSAFS